MAFPTTPTTGANTLLSSTTSAASTTHTFPSLTTLAPAAGDLIIAICVQYQGGSSNAEFGTWGASLTEFADLATVTALDQAIGAAYKVASGSETGTFTVTSGHSFKSVNFLMRIPAATWRSSTAPEITAAVRATGAVANVGALAPSWGAADTLWIAVAGQSETTTTGSPPTLDTPPTNYTGQLIVARAADAVGDITAGVAFRQVNTSSEDVGVWTASNANRGNGIAATIAIRPAAASLTGISQSTETLTIGTAAKSTRKAVSQSEYTFGAAVAATTSAGPRTTAVARISLASGGVPETTDDHSIHVRARVQTGTGVLFAALYEGSNNRSGDLSTPLSTSLADYKLSIPAASAANITNYSNLEVRLWGYTATGGSNVYEVDQLFFEAPASTATGPADITGDASFTITESTQTIGLHTGIGVSQSTYAVGIATAGTPTRKAVSQSTFTLGIAESGSYVRRGVSQSTYSLNIFSRATGVANITGAASFTITDTFVTAATALRFASVTDSTTATINTVGRRGQFGVTQTTYVLGRDTAGKRTATGVVSTPLILSIDSAGRATLKGISQSTYTLAISTTGRRIITGVSQSTYTFGIATAGIRGKLGSVTTPLVLTIGTAGKATRRGSVTAPFVLRLIAGGIDPDYPLLSPISETTETLTALAEDTSLTLATLSNDSSLTLTVLPERSP